MGETRVSLADESVDLTVTSPPYDNIRDYHGYVFDWQKTISELYRVTKQGGWSCELSQNKPLTVVKVAHHFDKPDFDVSSGDVIQWTDAGWESIKDRIEELQTVMYKIAEKGQKA